MSQSVMKMLVMLVLGPPHESTYNGMSETPSPDFRLLFTVTVTMTLISTHAILPPRYHALNTSNRSPITLMLTLTPFLSTQSFRLVLMPAEQAHQFANRGHSHPETDIQGTQYLRVPLTPQQQTRCTSQIKVIFASFTLSF